jgi:dsRNA-specific ribonuclease
MRVPACTELSDCPRRLAFLGDQVLALVITDILWKDSPVARTGQLSVSFAMCLQLRLIIALQPRKAYLVSKPQVARWSEEYDLPRRIRGPEHQLLTIQNNERQKAQVFQAYIACLFLQEGYLRTRAWMLPLVEATYEAMLTETEENEVDQLLDDGSDATSTASPPQSTGTVPSSPQPNPPSTPRRSSTINNMNSPRSPPASPSGALAAFNQLCSQNHLEADWTELTLGKDHQRTFTMSVKGKLIFWIEVVLTGASVHGDNEILGKGTAPTKRGAQQIAADAALKKMPRYRYCETQ